MVTTTLADRVLRDFSKIKIKKASVKVPRLKVRKKVMKLKKNDKIPIYSIINILVKTAIKKDNLEKKEKSLVEEDRSYIPLKEDMSINTNGYGTVSKGYGVAPNTSYVGYLKLFSYLGKFKSQNPYENMPEQSRTNSSLNEGRFQLIDSETIGKAVAYKTYSMAFPDMRAFATSLVPIGGMSSDEWEKFKLWMKLDPVMFRYKIG